MKRIYLISLLVLPTSVMAQSPVRETVAYSRKTNSGIPGNNPFPTSYYIYVVIQRGVAISLRGVCLQGTRYGASLRRVAAPVVIERDVGVPTGKKDTLVEKTPDDVYEVAITQPEGSCGKDEEDLARRHEVVVCLASGASRWYGLVTKIVSLPPAAAM